MSSVTFSTAVGGDGSTVTDDSNASTGLANGGHRTRFVPALAQVVAVADYVVDTASAFNNGQTWAYDATTTMADPGTGEVRLNNADVSLVTQISVSALSSTSGNPDISALVMTWDDSTNTNKGSLTIRKGGRPATFASFTVNGSLTDNGTWIQIPVTYVTHNGTWTAADQMFVSFARSGDAGAGDFNSDGSVPMTGSLQLGAGLGVIFEGTTADTFETTLSAGEPTADNVVTLPDATTTLAGLAVAQSFTAQQTFKELKDTVYTITDGAAFEIDPANGSEQVVTLGASRTPAATNFEAGQTVLLGIDDGTDYTITWTTVNPTWVVPGGTATAPTLATTGYTWIIMTKIGSTIYAAEWGQP